MKKKKRSTISTDEFKRLLDGLEVLNIVVDEFDGKVHDRSALSDREQKRVIKLTESARYRHENDEIVSVWHTYKLKVNGEGEETRRLFELSVTFRLRYACAEEFDNEFFSVFETNSLRLQTSPFARAWIHDHCLRLGVPPLFLPLVRTR